MRGCPLKNKSSQSKKLKCEVVNEGPFINYSEIQWKLSKMVTGLGSHRSKKQAPNSTKALQFPSVEQPPLHKG